MTNELLLDGSARLNLATFVTTWMPPDACRLMAETADKNMIDKDEYPQTAEFETSLREHDRPALACARRGRPHRLFDHRVKRGGHARRTRAEVALARADEGGR